MGKVYIEKKELEKNIFIRESKLFSKSKFIQLNEKNAKRIYFSCKCSFEIIKCKTFFDWVTSNFSKYDLCKWNNDYLNIQITKLETKLKRKKITSFKDFETLINDCFIYSNDENLLNRLLFILEKIGNQIGFQKLFNNDTFYDCETKNIEKMLSSINKEASEESNRHLKEYGNLYPNYLKEDYGDDLSIVKFFPNAKYCGLLANVCYNGFQSLCRNYVEKLLVPFINSFSDRKTSVNTFLGYQHFVYIKKFLLEFDNEIANFFENGIIELIKNCPRIINSQKNNVFELKIKKGKKCYSIGALHLKNNVFVTDSILFSKEKLKVGFFDSTSSLDYNILDKNKSLGICFFKINNNWGLPNFNEDISANISSNKLLVVQGSKAVYNRYKRGWINDSWDSYFSSSYGKIIKQDDKRMTINAKFPTNIYGAWAYDLNGTLIGLVKASKKNGDNFQIVPINLILNALKSN
ncbi:MAG: hypothetical protein K6E21_00630 [Bacilli bacterium]|nr:hypothetical protein [Bacilli bacterium]